MRFCVCGKKSVRISTTNANAFCHALLITTTHPFRFSLFPLTEHSVRGCEQHLVPGPAVGWHDRRHRHLHPIWRGFVESVDQVGSGQQQPVACVQQAG